MGHVEGLHPSHGQGYNAESGYNPIFIRHLLQTSGGEGGLGPSFADEFGCTVGLVLGIARLGAGVGYS